MNSIESSTYEKRMRAITENYARMTGYSEVMLEHSAKAIKRIVDHSRNMPQWHKDELLDVCKELAQLEALTRDIWENKTLGGYAESALGAKKGLVSTEVA
jgi:ATP-dependent Zn protease